MAGQEPTRGGPIEKAIIKPVASDAVYTGRFAEMHFELLANPIPIYRSLLKHLSQYKVTLDSLRIDTSVLSSAAITCNLFAADVTVIVRIERFEVVIRKLHDLSEEQADDILDKTWSAIREVVESASLAEHHVLLNIYASLATMKYDELMQRYVMTPSNLRDRVHAGVVFYLPADDAAGARPGSIILDRIGVLDDALLLKINTAFGADRVSISVLRKQLDDYVTKNLDLMGLALDRG